MAKLMSNQALNFLTTFPDKCWYAIYTKPRHEKSVKRLLDEKQVENFLPLTTEVSRWADRRVEVSRPLFPGYLFANYSIASDAHRILATEGIIRVVGTSSRPLPVTEEEIHSLQLLLTSKLPFASHAYLQSGQKVRVISGPLSGMIGLVQKHKNKGRIIIAVDLIQRALAAEVDLADLVPIRELAVSQ